MTSFRTQAKSHKGLKGAVVFTRRCFTIKLNWKILQNIHSKESVMKCFFQLSHNLQLYWKRTSSQLFSNEIRKEFIILFCIKTLVNLLKALKEQKYLSEDVQEKNWPKKFHKIQQKETMMKSSFWLRRKLQLHLNRTSSQLFSDDLCKIFQNNVFVRNSKNW